MNSFIKEHYSSERKVMQVDKSLSPHITVGEHIIIMENQTLDDIHHITNATINNGVKYKWLCVKTRNDVSYAFISDKETGQGDLTSVVMLKHAEGCKPYSGNVSVVINDVPLFDATADSLTFAFGDLSTSYYKESAVENGYTQSNSVQYYFTGREVRGVVLSHVTEN